MSSERSEMGKAIVYEHLFRNGRWWVPADDTAFLAPEHVWFVEGSLEGIQRACKEGDIDRAAKHTREALAVIRGKPVEETPRSPHGPRRRGLLDRFRVWNRTEVDWDDSSDHVHFL